MKSSFTIDDLFLFEYYETHLSNDHMVHPEIEANEMKTELEELMGSDQASDENCVSPDERIISNIMSYSRALNVVRTRQAGNITLLMN